MNLGFAARLAAREARHGFRRVGVYMASITLGVAALVSIHSFRDDVARSVREEAEALMGADARIGASRPVPDSVGRIVDSLVASGADTAAVTTATSLVLAPVSGDVRLMQVRGVSGGYPFYGAVTTRPAGAWNDGIPPGVAFVDPAVLTQLRSDLGDTIVVGGLRLPVVATVDDLPTDVAFQAALGPRVHLAMETLEAAGLLGFGSLARYEVFVRLPDQDALEAVEERYDSIFDATRVRWDTAEEQARELSNGVRFLARFLGLVGLGALLLGGIGVASAIHVYILERRPGVAVLRCVGADQWTLFLAYLIQAAGLGLLGALSGVVVGVGIQRLLPLVLAGSLPVDVTPRFSWTSAAAGVGIGVWVAMIFALIPLLALRDVPPLQALRQDVTAPRPRRDAVRAAAWLALLASVVLLCVLEAPEPGLGLAFALALLLGAALLAAAGWGLARVTRRFFPAWAAYPVRQGVSNLFRPRNQTVSVTVALGFGALIVGTVVQVQANLVDDLNGSFGEGRPNVLLFDVQADQRDGIEALLPDAYRGTLDVAPLVTSRLAAINGVDVEDLRADTLDEDRPERWALRREYRNTYRADIGPAEELVSGRWWDDTPGSDDGTRVDTGGLPGVSLELDIAEDLRVGLGDTLTWTVAGRRISSVVTSLRRVDWGRLEPNFFAVLEPGSLDDAPQTLIMVARLPTPEGRAAFQRSLVETYPNVSALDFSRVQEAIDGVLSRVRQAVGFLGAFTLAAGLLVLVGSLAASRAQRLREGALLKTLGARRGQVLVVLLSEYLALGTLATAAGLVLAWVGAALLVPGVFEIPFRTHPLPMLGIWLAVTGLTVLVGLAGSRRLLAQPPLAVLREAPE